MKKKTWFYAMALVCSMSLFTACSDDDEPWENIPKTEITTESGNLAVKVNGETSANGSVKVTAKNASEAVTTLKNIVPGYPEVDIDVELEEQADQTFRFVGAKELYTAPTQTKAANSLPGLMSVEVSGTIDLEGKATVDVTAYGPGLHVGSYDGSNLVLTRNGSELMGATVVYSIVEDATPVLTLGGVIPGELQASIAGVYPARDGSFSGEATTAGGTKVNYSGKMNVATGVLTLGVNITLSDSAQGGLAGTWNLSLQYPYTVGDFDMETFTTPQYLNPYPPIRLTWTAKNSDDLNAEQCATVLTNLCSKLLTEVVQSVSLSDNSDLTASYYPQPIFDQRYDWATGEWTQLGPDDGDPMMSWMMYALLVTPTTTEAEAPNTEIPVYPRTWTTSPAGLVSWYVQGGQLYLIPNLTAILKQISADQGTDTGMEGMDLTAILGKLTELGIDQAKLTALLPQIMEWLTTGIPLKYEVTGDRLSLYVSKEMVTPFMELLLPALPALWEKVLEADPTGMAGMAVYLLGITKIEDLQTIWENNTENFSITLNLKK